MTTQQQILSDRPVDQAGLLTFVNRQLIPVVRRIQNLIVNGTLGAAGGDLSGQYPNPTVAKVKATAVTTAGGALATGAVMRTTGAAAADWGPVDLSNASAAANVLPAANVAPAAAASPTATPVGLTFSTGAGTADGIAYTVPASPSGAKRYKTGYVVARLTTAITGGGTVVIRARTTTGGNDLLVDSASWTSATAVGTEHGMSIAVLGTGFPASTGYVAELDAAATVNFRATTGGGGITGGAATLYVYGCLETS